MAKHRTSKGREVDMEALRAHNEKVVALGNMGVNAAGDKIGRGGKVIETSQERVRAYNSTNPKAVRKVSVKDPISEEAEVQEIDISATAASPKSKKPKGSVSAKKKVSKEIELEDGSIQIIPEESDRDGGVD